MTPETLSVSATAIRVGDYVRRPDRPGELWQVLGIQADRALLRPVPPGPQWASISDLLKAEGTA
jgi:hypothetical protein